MKLIVNSLFLLACFFSSCTLDNDEQIIFLAQGLMSGEPTESSIILQSRLTTSDTLIDGDIPGMAGKARFEISEHENFENSQFSEVLSSDSISDFIIKFAFENLKNDTRYLYRLHFGNIKEDQFVSEVAIFKTNPRKGQKFGNILYSSYRNELLSLPLWEL